MAVVTKVALAATGHALPGKEAKQRQQVPAEKSCAVHAAEPLRAAPETDFYSLFSLHTDRVSRRRFPSFD